MAASLRPGAQAGCLCRVPPGARSRRGLPHLSSLALRVGGNPMQAVRVAAFAGPVRVCLPPHTRTAGSDELTEFRVPLTALTLDLANVPVDRRVASALARLVATVPRLNLSVHAAYRGDRLSLADTETLLTAVGLPVRESRLRFAELHLNRYASGGEDVLEAASRLLTHGGAAAHTVEYHY